MTGLVDALYKRILLAAHPVGSIYQSTELTDPGQLFGGTWERIVARFLYAVEDGYAAATGGELEHTLTADEMPSHSHRVTMARQTGSASWSTASGIGRYSSDAGGASFTVSSDNAGDGKPHNNMPPYYGVYTWRRTA